MIKKAGSNVARKRRHARVRKHISGTAQRPRLCVYRSLSNIYAQVIDDVAGKTLVAASSFGKSHGREKRRKRRSGERSRKLVAEKAKAAGITSVVFDRGGYIYHGRVAALAEGAREGGLEF